MSRAATLALLALALLTVGLLGGAGHAIAAQDRYFRTSDGVRLHWIEAGPPGAPTMLLVPGWAMPAWIFDRQIAAFSARYHVAALDPRGQGDSEVPPGGYDQDRRGADIAELIAALGPRPVLLLGWSLGVLDSLAYVHARGDGAIAGLVLVDNSIGEDPAPVPRPPRPGPPEPWDAHMARFVRTMFATPRPRAWLDRLTDAALRLPQPDARRLLAYPVPRSYWKAAIYSTDKPVLYVVRPRLAGQAENLAAHRPGSETALFAHAGHALFVDEPERFDQMVMDFAARRVWPK